MKINLTTNHLLWATTSVLAMNTVCLIDAMREIAKLQKVIKGHRKYEKFLEELTRGMEIIACNPKADPMENRQAVQELVIRVKGDMVLDGVDIDKELEKFREG